MQQSDLLKYAVLTRIRDSVHSLSGINNVDHFKSRALVCIERIGWQDFQDFISED